MPILLCMLQMIRKNVFETFRTNEIYTHACLCPFTTIPSACRSQCMFQCTANGQQVYCTVYNILAVHLLLYLFRFFLPFPIFYRLPHFFNPFYLTTSPPPFCLTPKTPLNIHFGDPVPARVFTFGDCMA